MVLGYVLNSIARVLSFLGRVKLREKNVEEVEQAKSHKIRKKKFKKYHVPDRAGHPHRNSSFVIGEMDVLLSSTTTFWWNSHARTPLPPR